MPVDYAGNTLGTAKGLNITPSTQTFTDYVDSLDTNDYYRFRLSDRSSFNLSLNGLSANADVQLLNSSGSVIKSSLGSGTAAESIASTLNTGTYYIRVYPNGDASTNYDLSVSATPLDYAGNTTSTARSITVGPTPTTYSDWVGSADTNDYYRFSLSGTSNFNLALNGLSANADVQLLNSSGSVITNSAGSGTAAESITSSLDAGTYYIQVYPYGDANTKYNLSVSADYAGNTTSTARSITVGSTTTTYSDWVGSTDTNDYYRFSLSGTSNFNMALNNLSANANVQLLNSSGTVITSASNNGTLAESITSTLNADTYYIQVYPYGGANTKYNLSVSATPAPSDWFSQNLLDEGIINTARNLAGDGQLNRNDMIGIFRDAKDNSFVDTNELKDLRTIVSNASRFNMPDYVHVLSNKIANGNVANTRSGIGNLVGGSSDTQVEQLIGKWFLGSDRPSAPSGYTMTYELALGSLFGSDNTFSYQDVSQGYLGDCYLLAALGANALQRPSAIQDMFIDNGDGTYTVRLFGQNDGKATTAADYVTVDKFLPTNVSANGYSEQSFAYYDSDTVGLWVALAEKAYAQFAESGEIQRDYTTNSYGSIEGGNGYLAMPSISGVNGGYYSDIYNDSSRLGNFLSFESIDTILKSGQAMTAGAIPGSELGKFAGHEYIVTGVNTSDKTLTLYDPWGITSEDGTNAIRTISYNDFKANFELINVA